MSDFIPDDCSIEDTGEHYLVREPLKGYTFSFNKFIQKQSHARKVQPSESHDEDCKKKMKPKSDVSRGVFSIVDIPLIHFVDSPLTILNWSCVNKDARTALISNPYVPVIRTLEFRVNDSISPLDIEIKFFFVHKIAVKTNLKKLNVFVHFPNCNDVILWNNWHISNEIFQFLGQIKKLEISNCKNLSSKGFAGLKGIENLVVSSYNPKIQNRDLVHLKDTLRELTVWCPGDVFNESGKHIGEYMGDYTFNGNGIRHLTNLRKLTLANAGAMSSKFLESMCKLEYLFIDYPSDLKKIVLGKKREEVLYGRRGDRKRKFRIRKVMGFPFENLGSLKELRLRVKQDRSGELKFKDIDDEIFKHFPRLEKLTLEDCFPVGKEGFSYLQCLKELKLVGSWDEIANGKFLDCLAENSLETFTRFEFNDTWQHFGAKVVTKIVQFPNLRTLVAHDNKFSEDELFTLFSKLKLERFEMDVCSSFKKTKKEGIEKLFSNDTLQYPRRVIMNANNQKKKELYENLRTGKMYQVVRSWITKEKSMYSFDEEYRYDWCVDMKRK